MAREYGGKLNRRCRPTTQDPDESLGVITVVHLTWDWRKGTTGIVPSSVSPDLNLKGAGQKFLYVLGEIYTSFEVYSVGMTEMTKLVYRS
jgi:hypothetical protein